MDILYVKNLVTAPTNAIIEETPKGYEILVPLLTVVLFSVFYLFQINSMTEALCMRREIPEEKQPKIFRTINVLVTILLVTFYVEVFFAV